jgi:hypothetical protein
VLYLLLNKEYFFCLGTSIECTFKESLHHDVGVALVSSRTPIECGDFHGEVLPFSIIKVAESVRFEPFTHITIA